MISLVTKATDHVNLLTDQPDMELLYTAEGHKSQGVGP